MPPVLGTFDMTAMYLAAIFYIGNAPAAATGGVVALTYLLVGGLTFFLPTVIATAQLGAMFPHEGSIYHWTHKALGPYWGFLAGISYWLPNVLAIVGAADGFVTFLQGVHNSWLTQPWQQGLAILLIIGFTTILSAQSLRTTQNVVNISIMLTLGVALLIVLTCAIWFALHGSKTPLGHPADWQVNSQNFSLFGLIAFLYLGATIPMNMAGEVRPGVRITRHLFWGTILVLIGYPITTFALLVVRGPALAQATVLPYEVINMISSVLGDVAGSISTICLLSFYLISALVYNYATARLLFTASVDGYLPTFLGRLNTVRAPRNAVLVQSFIAALFVALIFFVAPSVSFIGNPVNLATKVYNVLLAAMTVIWGLSTLFLFLDLLVFYFRDRPAFHKQRIFPMWLLWLCSIVGTLSCLVIVIDTFENSWTPLIPNSSWWYIIGAIMAISIGLATAVSMYASSQASYEKFEHTN